MVKETKGRVNQSEDSKGERVEGRNKTGEGFGGAERGGPTGKGLGRREEGLRWGRA